MNKNEEAILIRTCLKCSSHNPRKYLGNWFSYCEKELGWSRYTQCIAQKALEKFLSQERLENEIMKRISEGEKECEKQSI